MYLARTTREHPTRFFIRETFRDGNVLKSRDTWDENDIYAEVIVDGRLRGRTHRVSDNNNPTMDYEIDISDYGGEPILVRLFDQDGPIDADDFIGSTVITNPITGTYPVIGFAGEDEIGTIEVSFR